MTRLDEIKKDFASANPDLNYTSMMREDIQYLIELGERYEGDLRAIRDMPDYDQDNEHRMRYIAKQALNKEGE